MKNILLSILTLIATLMFCGCSADTNEEWAEESKPVSVRINIFASTGGALSEAAESWNGPTTIATRER